MSRWFRFYDEVLDDPKVQRLSPHLFKVWVNLLCLASKEDGKLPAVGDISFRLRVSETDAKTYLDDLILAGLIDITDSKGSMRPHNWPERQFQSDTSKERTRKWRNKNKKQDGDADVTSQVTDGDAKSDGTEQTRAETEPESKTEQTREPRAKAGFSFGNVTGSEVPEVERELMRRAEGLGLNSKAIEGECFGPNVKNPSAYFQSLCKKRLREMVPGISDDVIGRGLCGDLKAYGTLMDLIMMVGSAR